MGGTGGGCVGSEETLLDRAAERDCVDRPEGTAAGVEADCLCREVKIENGLDFLVVGAFVAVVLVGERLNEKASLIEL